MMMLTDSHVFNMWAKYLFTYYIVGIEPLVSHMRGKHYPQYYTPSPFVCF